MSNFTGFGSFLLFMALRTHFTTEKYNFFQMNGRVRATKQSYEKRNDRWFFEKIGKKYDAKELRDFYISNLLEDKNYITDFVNEESNHIFMEYNKRQQSLSYTFKNDLNIIFENDLKQPFEVYRDKYPSLIMLFLQKKICLETLVILDDFTGFSNKFDKHYTDDFIWPRISRKINKYRDFLKYDKAKIKNILKGVVNEQRETSKEISSKE